VVGGVVAVAADHIRTESRLTRLPERLSVGPGSVDDDSSLIWAAVAAILTPDPEAVLLIRRAERAGDPWSGHMALPGGRREPADPDLLATVVRETAEELGVDISGIPPAGILEDVVPRTPVLPPVAVRPFVFVLRTRPVLNPNHEIASAQWVSLDDLLRPGAYHPVRLTVAQQNRDFPAYQIENALIWGMTERILTNLLDHVR
jgi:8-oxo-dGTP pyrophosphatase MutT (NUDIX family)